MRGPREDQETTKKAGRKAWTNYEMRSPCRFLGDYSAAQRDQHHSGAISSTQFAPNAGEMALDHKRREFEEFPTFAVTLPTGYQLQDHAFAVSEPGCGRSRAVLWGGCLVLRAVSGERRGINAHGWTGRGMPTAAQQDAHVAAQCGSGRCGINIGSGNHNVLPTPGAK